MIDPVSLGVAVLQAGILAVLAVALRRGNLAAVANAVASLAAALVPVVGEVALRSTVAPDFGIGPGLALWVAAAGLLHSVGMLGPYDSVGWWDTLTHAVSAALVAALVYGSLVVLARDGGRWVTTAAVAPLTVGLTLAGGVFWELIELVARAVGERYDVEPVLVHYGWDDTAVDLVFDAAGAAVVVLLDVRIAVPIAERFPGATATALLVAGAVVAGGSAAMAVGLHLASRGASPE